MQHENIFRQTNLQTSFNSDFNFLDFFFLLLLLVYHLSPQVLPQLPSNDHHFGYNLTQMDAPISVLSTQPSVDHVLPSVTKTRVKKNHSTHRPLKAREITRATDIWDKSEFLFLLFALKFLSNFSSSFSSLSFFSLFPSFDDLKSTNRPSDAAAAAADAEEAEGTPYSTPMATPVSTPPHVAVKPKGVATGFVLPPLGADGAFPSKIRSKSLHQRPQKEAEDDSAETSAASNYSTPASTPPAKQPAPATLARVLPVLPNGEVPRLRSTTNPKAEPNFQRPAKAEQTDSPALTATTTPKKEELVVAQPKEEPKEELIKQEQKEQPKPEQPPKQEQKQKEQPKQEPLLPKEQPVKQEQQKKEEPKQEQRTPQPPKEQPAKQEPRAQEQPKETLKQDPSEVPESLLVSQDFEKVQAPQAPVQEVKNAAPQQTRSWGDWVWSLFFPFP